MRFLWNRKVKEDYVYNAALTRMQNISRMLKGGNEKRYSKI